MAWAEKQRSGRYAGKYRDAAGTPRSVGTFTRKAEAERQAATREDEVRRNPQAVDPRDGRITWAQWRRQWQPRRGVEKTTEAGDTSFINNRVEPRWGNTPLNAIRREDVQQWVTDLQSELGAWSVIHCYRLLSNSLTAAVIERRLSSSPCVKVKLPKPPEDDDRFLSHAEVSAITRVLSEPYRTMVLLLVGTGMRWGEAAALHWSRLNLGEQVVEVVDAWDNVAGEVKPYPKSRKRRFVPLAPWLVDVLLEHRERYPASLRCSCRHRPGVRCRSGLVVPGEGGVTMDYPNFRIQHWGRAVGRTEWVLPDGRRFGKRSDARRRAPRGVEGVPEWTPGLALVGGVPVEHATIHTLRHTFASWTQQAEPPLPLHDLSVIMGHHSVKVTERYAHLADSSRRRVLASLAWPTAPTSAMHSPCTEQGEREA